MVWLKKLNEKYTFMEMSRENVPKSDISAESGAPIYTEKLVDIPAIRTQTSK